MSIEIEVKVLLSSEDDADRFLSAFPGCELKGSESQLNHYFVGDLDDRFLAAIEPHAQVSKTPDLAVCLTGSKKSIRTRQIVKDDPRNPEVLLIVKSSLNETTSENGTVRKEVELPVLMSLERLDAMLIEHGLEYQSKWSRERSAYQYQDVSISIDKNAGYGYVAELEKIAATEDEALEAEKELRSLLALTGFEELPQDRLERMFAFYNANWPQYYGTEKTFEVE